MKTSFLLTVLALTGIAQASGNSKSITEAAASFKIDSIIKSHDLNLNERIVFFGHTSDGLKCGVEFSKRKYFIRGFDGNSTNVSFFVGDFEESTEDVAELAFFYKASTEEYLSKYSHDPQVRSIEITENSKEIIINDNVETTIAKYHKLVNNKSFKLVTRKDGSLQSAVVVSQSKESGINFNYLRRGYNPVLNEESSSTRKCFNLEAAGKRKIDYNFGANLVSDTNLHAFCSTFYNKDCPNNLPYTSLPESLKSLTLDDIGFDYGRN